MPKETIELITSDDSHVVVPLAVIENQCLLSRTAIGANHANDSISTPPERGSYNDGINTWIDKLIFSIALLAWYTVGVLAIVTTKVLITRWNCPPMVLTVQQLILGHFILRLVVLARDGAVQPMPWHRESEIVFHTTPPTENGGSCTSNLLQHYKRRIPWLRHYNFVLAGVFNSLDFLCSNTAFSKSAAHFVETIKASDPITTTAVALLFGVDTLTRLEGASLFFLVAGVLLSTWGNSSRSESKTDGSTEITDGLDDSILTALLVTTANICFAFRAMNQKKYRVKTSEGNQLDDANLFCRMCQVGATFLILPLIIFHWRDVELARQQPADVRWSYTGLALINSVSYVTYNLASTYVLSKLTVLHHSALNCLRRMIAILATSIFFQKPMNAEALAGLCLSFLGFSSFTYHRASRQWQLPVIKTKDSNV